MDARTLAQRTLKRLMSANDDTAENGGRAELLFAMWRDCREWMPSAARITDYHLGLVQKHLEDATSGSMSGLSADMGYNRWGGFTGLERATINLEAFQHRRAIWQSIEALLDAPDDRAAAERFIELVELDAERPTPEQVHGGLVDIGPQFGRFTYPIFHDAEAKATPGWMAWRVYNDALKEAQSKQ